MSGTAVLRWRVTGLATAIAAVLASGSWVAASSGATAQGAQRPVAADAHTSPRALRPAAKPVSVVSVTPAASATEVNGTAPISVTFSAPLAADSPMPALTPAIPGTWKRTSPATVQFVPDTGFTEQVQVKVTVPAGPSGVRSAAGGQLPAPVVSTYTTGSYSPARVDQLLAQLGYLPLTWAPAAGTAPVTAGDATAQLSAAYDPPQGAFTWQPGYPSQLEGQWNPDEPNKVLTGAVMAFESDHGLGMDGVAGPRVWAALLSAVAAGRDNAHGYTYALASQATPESLTVWHDGKVIMHSPANTGVAGAQTTVGTFPVYLRYQFQIMRGKNLDGSSYADPVSWVSYFRAGEAVHYFSRASYGFPQSLGCVELPMTQAKYVWPYMTYGTLVTVTAA